MTDSSNISVGIEFIRADPSFLSRFSSSQVRYGKKLREVLELVRRERHQLTIMRRWAWCHLHDKKLRRFHFGLLTAGETEEGKGGEDEEEAEQSYEDEQDVDEVSLHRAGRWAWRRQEVEVGGGKAFGLQFWLDTGRRRRWSGFQHWGWGQFCGPCFCCWTHTLFSENSVQHFIFLCVSFAKSVYDFLDKCQSLWITWCAWDEEKPGCVSQCHNWVNPHLLKNGETWQIKFCKIEVWPISFIGGCGRVLLALGVLLDVRCFLKNILVVVGLGLPLSYLCVVFRIF